MIVEDIARQIVDKLPCVDISSHIPDFGAAYATQDGVIKILTQECGGLAGYKIAWNSPEQIAQFAPNAPAFGHLFVNHVYPSGISFTAADFAQLVVEPEIIAVIGSDIVGEDHSADSVLPYIEKFHAGFEIMDRRGAGVGVLQHPPSIVANNIFNKGMVIGGEGARDVNFANIETVVHQDGVEILRMVNAAPQHPALAVATIANILAGRGKSLKSGDRILCGTHMPPFEVKSGALCVSMGVLGEATFTYR